MRAILTPFVMLFSLVIWGQTSQHPFPEFSQETVDQAVLAWEHKRSSVQEEFSVAPRAAMEIAAVTSRDLFIHSVKRGAWSDATTWDCQCIPAAGDMVQVHHEIGLSEDANCNSLTVTSSGHLFDVADATLTLGGDLVALGSLALDGVHLTFIGEGTDHTMAAHAEMARLLANPGTSLSIEGNVVVTERATADNAIITVAPEGSLTLGNGPLGRASALRPGTGEIIGLVTREIILPATANHGTLNTVEQRISLGLEGVTVDQFVGDIPTWGFDGADSSEGWSNLGYWDVNSAWSYKQITSIHDSLPVVQGIYLALAPAESYTLTFEGTLPGKEVALDVPADLYPAVFGNALNAPYNLNAIGAASGNKAIDLSCWNIEALQFDTYVQGHSTNGLNGILNPNTTCQVLPNETMTIEFSLGEVDLTEGTNLAEERGHLVFSVSNQSGYSDEALLFLTDSATTGFVSGEDGRNTKSWSASCDLYLLDENNNRMAISQVDFAREAMHSYDLILAANSPIDGEYAVEVSSMNWAEGCVQFTMEGEATAHPLEEGHLTDVTLNSEANSTYTIGQVHVIPEVRDISVSPGCEGLGSPMIEVIPNGEGPWAVALTDGHGNAYEGESDNGLTWVFEDLPSGEFIYEVQNEGSFACGAQVGQQRVIRPTRMVFSHDLQHDCGEGGAAMAQATGGSGNIAYAWSNGTQGNAMDGVEGGDYAVVATDDFGCRDTLHVTVLTSPEVNVMAVDGDCEGLSLSAIEVNSDNADAKWDVEIFDGLGEVVRSAMDSSTPIFFDGLPTDDYTIQALVLGEYGCDAQRDQASIIQPFPMTLDLETVTQCDDAHLGSIDAEVFGGVNPAISVWNDNGTEVNPTALLAGQYNVEVVDEDGCIKMAEAIVAMSPQMDVQVLSASCHGQAEIGFVLTSEAETSWNISVQDTQGTLMFEDAASNGTAEILGLAPGNYTLSTQSNAGDGCPSKTTIAAMGEASDLNVEVHTTAMGCGDEASGEIQLTVSGGLGQTHIDWSHGAQGTFLEGLSGGEYEAVLMDDNGCTETVRVQLDETPTVRADFVAPTGGLTDGQAGSGMTLSFTNTSEGNITGNTWYFGDTDEPNYDHHAVHTFAEVGAYDVFLNVWNDQCSHTVRQTVVVSAGDHPTEEDEWSDMVSSIAEGNLSKIQAPITTQTGWMMDLGAAADGMTMHAMDLTGRVLCSPIQADGQGQIWVEKDQWPALVLLRLVHGPTQTARTWKMVR
jgi:hypothetical protein